MFNIRTEGFKRYFANTSWMMAERILRMAVTLFVGVYVARYLGPERFGLLSYAISFVGIFSAVAYLGLDEIVIRNLARDLREQDNILGTAFLLKGMGAILAFILILLALQFSSGNWFSKIIVLTIALGLIFQTFNVIAFYFQSQVLAKVNSLAFLFALFISSAAKLWLIAVQAPLIWFALAIILENAVIALGLFIMCLRHDLNIFKWRFNYLTAKELLKESWPVMLSGILIMIYLYIDQIMIKEMLGNEAVGLYAVATRISGATYFIPIAITMSLFPAVINAKKLDQVIYHNRTQQLYDLMVWLSIAIVVPTALFSNKIILLLFGDQYAQAGPVLSVHIWASIFFFLMVASEKWFLAEDLTKLLFYRALMGAILNIILNFILIPRYNILGAAIASVIAQFVVGYLYDAFNKNTLVSFKLKTKSFFPVHLLNF